jgi:phosphopentomutase
MRHAKRVILIVLDGFGAGETEDAHQFGDEGAYTSRHILEKHPEIKAPFLLSHGLLSSSHSDFLVPEHPNKDTLSGLYELMGLVFPKLPTFPKGFPASDINNLEILLHRNIIGNYPASGTQIIQALGPQHMSSSNLIVYTSSDSVFQIAAHQEVIALSQLYYYCSLVRNYFHESNPIGRIIARPFVGSEQLGFIRTPNRKDFPYIPPQKHLLHFLQQKDIQLFGNRVIENMFPNLLNFPMEGKEDVSCLNELINLLSKPSDHSALYFVDLEDLDMLYGHRRDVPAYASALEQIDPLLATIENLLSKDDMLIITADHGNDPSFMLHTDHTRENVPYLILEHKKPIRKGKVHGMHWISDLIRNFYQTDDAS